MGYIEELRALVGHRPLILCGAIVIIEDEKGRILLQERRFPKGKWSLPGGLMELGESTEETARREVTEETGLCLGQLRLFGIYSGEKYFCVAENGDAFYVVTTVYRTKEFFGELRVNPDESISFQWRGLSDLPSQIAGTQREIVDDFVKSRMGEG